MVRGGSRTAATSKMELFVIIVNSFQLVNYYHKVLHLGRCSSPRSASDGRVFDDLATNYLIKPVSTVKESGRKAYNLKHECSPIVLLYIFRTPFLKNTSGRLLLNSVNLSLDLYVIPIF